MKSIELTRPSIEAEKALEPDSSYEKENDYEYKVLSNPYERINYVHLTDELIAKMDGTAGPRPDYVIFLDKSARPVNWMVRELWDTLATEDANGERPKRPGSLFIDIDARRKVDDSPESISDLRALYAIDSPADSVEMMDAPTLLDDKQILIVDEIQVSGDTLRKANDLFSKAFPSAKFENHGWMSGMPVGPGKNETNNPRWYERESNRYRAVLEPKDIEPEWDREQMAMSDERAQRGRQWLARIPEKLSSNTKFLMEDIHQLAVDVKSGDLPYNPSFARPDCDERIEKFSGISVDDFYDFIQWTKQHYWPTYNIASTRTTATGPLPDKEADAAHRYNNARGQRYDKKTLSEDGQNYAYKIGLLSDATRALASTFLRDKR